MLRFFRLLLGLRGLRGNLVLLRFFRLLLSLRGLRGSLVLLRFFRLLLGLRGLRGNLRPRSSLKNLSIPRRPARFLIC